MRNKFTAVEMGIFAVVSLIFMNSVYHLFMDGRLSGNERRPLAGTPVRSVPVTKTKMDDLAVYETRCVLQGESYETSASRIRILGPLCGAPNRSPASVNGTASATSSKPDPGLVSSTVENATTRFAATVFTDHGTSDFSTDFIPLEKGRNRIVMQFRYKTGKIQPIELYINRVAP